MQMHRAYGQGIFISLAEAPRSRAELSKFECHKQIVVAYPLPPPCTGKGRGSGGNCALILCNGNAQYAVQYSMELVALVTAPDADTITVTAHGHAQRWVGIEIGSDRGR